MQISSVSVNCSPSFSALMFGGMGYPIDHKPPISAIRRVNLFGDDVKTLSDYDDSTPLSSHSIRVLETLQSANKALLQSDIAERSGIRQSMVQKSLLPLVRRGLVFSNNGRPSHYTHNADLLKGLERIKRTPVASLAVIEKGKLVLDALTKTPMEFRKMLTVFQEIKRTKGDMRSAVDRLVANKAVVKEIRKGDTWLKIAGVV